MSDRPTDTGPFDVRIACPHCGNRIRLLDPDPREAQCPSCGSSFKLDPNATDAYKATGVLATLGRFVVLERLGGGSFGTVYKATDPALDRTVAVKVPRVGTFASGEERARFVREAKAAARLTHPGIVAVYEVAADADPPLIVSEFVDGPTLADRLTAGKPTARESAELVAALADALDYAHRNGVVHRDVKPGNILMADGSVPKLADFGLARRDDPAEITVTRAGEVLGTPAYMAPEQAAGRADVDGRADGYSLGVVLYELLTGVLPFRGNSRMLLHQVLHDDPPPPRRVNDTVPRDLETITLTAMAKLPGKRYATAGELAADLRRWLAGRPIAARPPGRVETAVKWVRRNPSVATLTAAVVLALTAGVAVSGYFAATWKRTAGRLDEELHLSRKKEGEAAVERGLLRCDQNEEKEGLLWLARGLELMAANGATDDEQWHVRMQLSLWGQHLEPRWVPLDGLTAMDNRLSRLYAADFLSVYVSVDLPSGEVLVRRYDVATGRVVTTYRSVNPEVGGDGPSKKFQQFFQVASNGKRIVLGVSDKRVPDVIQYRIWDTESAKQVTSGSVEWRKNDNIRWSPDLRLYLHFDSSDQTASWSVWDTNTHRRLCQIQRASVEGEYPYHNIQLSASGSRLAYLTREVPRIVRLLDASTGQIVADLRHPQTMPLVASFIFNPDGASLVTFGNDQTLRRWDASTGRLLNEVVTKGEIAQLKYSDDGRWVQVDDFSGRYFDATDLSPWPGPGSDPSCQSELGILCVKGCQPVEIESRHPVGRPFPFGYHTQRFVFGDRVLLLWSQDFDGAYLSVWDVAHGRFIGPMSGPDLDGSNAKSLIGLSFCKDPNPANRGYGLTHTILTPLDAAPERITLWAEALAGRTLDAAGTPVPLAADAVADRKARLAALGGSPLPPRP